MRHCRHTFLQFFKHDVFWFFEHIYDEGFKSLLSPTSGAPSKAVSVARFLFLLLPVYGHTFLSRCMSHNFCWKLDISVIHCGIPGYWSLFGLRLVCLFLQWLGRTSLWTSISPKGAVSDAAPQKVKPWPCAQSLRPPRVVIVVAVLSLSVFPRVC